MRQGGGKEAVCSFATPLVSLQATALEPHVRFMRSSGTNSSPLIALAMHYVVLPAFFGLLNVVIRVRDIVTGDTRARPEHLITLLQLGALAVARGSLLSAFGLWVLLHGVASSMLMHISEPLHRSAYSWSAGCPGEEADFGRHTVASTAGVYVCVQAWVCCDVCCIDRALADFESEETAPGRPLALFLRVFVYGSFNDHIAHHLFPTVCLSKQHLVRDAFLRIARSMGVPYSKRTHQELRAGTHRVLVRTEGDICYEAASRKIE